jgi:hypothetical protein
MLYDLYLLQLGFHSVAVDGKLVQKYERDNYIQRRNNKHRIHKIENTQKMRKQTQEEYK